MKTKLKFFVFALVLGQFIGTSANAQYDDSPGAQYKSWAIGQACRMGGQGVNMNQALGLIPNMILGPYGTIAAQQDFMKMSDLGKDKIKNIWINVVYGVVTNCPNNIGRSVYDGLQREIEYYKSTGNICEKWEQVNAQGQCLKSF